jgi:hypothetical protein
MAHTHLNSYVHMGLMVCLVLSSGAALAAGASATDDLWDPQRYIRVDEIKQGMEAYCLTDYGEAGIEKFAMRVVNVVRDYEPGHHLILMMGLDDRLKHTGPVQGCSGSPVYIDGRLAGALSRGWSFQRDPLYGVTPIEEMLRVGASKGSQRPGQQAGTAALQLDFSKPINFAEIDEQITKSRLLTGGSRSGATALPCPLQISGLPTDACQELAPHFAAMGLTAIPGISGTAQANGSATTFTPGCTVTIPLVAGDIKMNVLGTVTEVRDNRVYAFGHSFLDFGATSLPLAGGQIYTVVSHMMASFKLGCSGDIIGALTVDESVGIYGEIGAKAKMIPLTIHIEPCNGRTPQVYNCQVAYNRMLTPLLVRATFAGAAMPFRSGFPPDHTIGYNATIDLEDGRSIRFANTSTGMDLIEPVAEVGSSLALLMNHPFQSTDVKSIDIKLSISPKNIRAYLWSVNVSDTTVKPGEDIDVEVVVESYLKEKRRHQVKVNVPRHVSPGKYNLVLVGPYEYEDFLRKAMPYRFVATNDKTLVEALNDALSIDRTSLYCLLVLPPDGIAMDRAELPGFPETRSMVLQSNRQAIPAQPHLRWVEQVVQTGTVIGDKQIVPIIVKE